MKHTKGPWAISEDHHNNHSIKMGASITAPYEDAPTSPWFIARIECGSPDQEANAKLIAAAPDLLEALELLVERAAANDGDRYFHNSLDSARKAIQKATI